MTDHAHDESTCGGCGGHHRRVVDLAIVPTLLTQVEDQAEAFGWDQPAVLPTVRAHDAGEGAAMVEVIEMPGWPTAIGVTGHCVTAMQALTTSMVLTGTEPIPGLLGLILVDEVWGVMQDPDQPHPGDLSVHPDRVESRFVWFLGVDGSQRVIVRRRGDAAPQPLDNADEFGGRIPEVLRHLTYHAAGGTGAHHHDHAHGTPPPPRIPTARRQEP